LGSFYIKFCWKMKQFVCVRVCSTSTTVILGHDTILMEYANIGIKSASASISGWNCRGHCHWPLPGTWQGDYSTTPPFHGNRFTCL
jgi:hypothetical protein